MTTKSPLMNQDSARKYKQQANA